MGFNFKSDVNVGKGNGLATGAVVGGGGGAIAAAGIAAVSGFGAAEVVLAGAAGAAGGAGIGAGAEHLYSGWRDERAYAEGRLAYAGMRDALLGDAIKLSGKGSAERDMLKDLRKKLSK